MLEPQPFMGTGSAGSLDPHFWLDPLRMADAAVLVAAELSTLAPGVDWTAQATAYDARLRSADAEIEAILAAVPVVNRMLVTNHDSLGYFAARYGFEIVGVVIGGGSPLADPSSAELADLVAAVDRSGVSAIFAETTDSSALAEAVAAEVGREVAVVEVYTGSLG
ncbi:MAG: zinc ABC transporter substrate-binding protein, partial [bacterium]|nr:zinc ABC transporter substrate-binding protein [bacterium]